MKGYRRLLTRTSMLSVGAVMLIAGHGIILSYVLSYTALSAAVVLGVMMLVVITHLGWLAVLLGPLYALFRRRSRHLHMVTAYLPFERTRGTTQATPQ